jgi:hypothetical protein
VRRGKTVRSEEFKREKDEKKYKIMLLSVFPLHSPYSCLLTPYSSLLTNK